MKHKHLLPCLLMLAAFVNAGPGAQEGWSKDQALIQRLSEVDDNQYEIRQMLAMYSVDWAGEYPASLPELYKAAKEGNYWKPLRNPITGKADSAELGMDYVQYRPDIRHAGKVLYEPLRDAKGEIRDFRLYAVNDEGRLFKVSGKIYQLSDHSEYKPTGLYAAAAAGQLAPLQKAAPAALDALDRYGMTPLMWAALNNHTETVRWLRAKGARFAPENRAGYSEAYLAVMSGDSDWVNEAIAKEKGLNYEDEENSSALVLATEAGRIEWVRAMLDKGAHGAEKALVSAVILGNDELIKLLLDPGKANIQSALNAASAQGNVDIVNLLLEQGARVDQPDSEGNYPLEGAASQGELEVVKLLLEKGADVNAQNQSTGWTAGWTALMRASYTSQIDVLNVLLSHGAKLDLSDQAGKTALIIVAEGYTSEAMQWLLDQGSDPSLRDKEGHSAGYYAADKQIFQHLMPRLRSTDTEVDLE